LKLFSEMSVSSNDLRSAIEILEKATAHDAQCRYSEAAHLYALALEYLPRALQVENNVQTRNVIQKKIQEYSTRLSQLQMTQTTPITGFPKFCCSTPSVTSSGSLSSTMSSSSSKPLSLRGIVEAIQSEELLEQQNSTTKRQSFVSAPPQIDWSALQRAEKEKWTNSESTPGELFDHLDNAVKTIERATKADSNGNYLEALELYRLGLEYFMKAYEVD